ncbi:NAD-dependent protein deacetylase SRT1 isoform X5 [Manihot esculenta]|uniref:NAD-dependent protein deacetylase SRT1 isoform X5 n=1 Tax=Manihot esculenta TaxID=3983 RepID=UPI001CC79C88|nr:NAD-dependent protein deacetylase SRT1 isoform X5 [Manihot esculenta]
MSLGYAEKLSFIEDVGKVGMTEFFDSSYVLQEKIERLAKMIQKVQEYQLLVAYLIFEALRESGHCRYLRDFEVETIGLKETSRRCTDVKCGAKLRDTVLDWEDALPPKEMLPAEKHCRMADLLLCLGTSLQITPACNLPLKCLRGGGKIVIVNLQKTPKDKNACLVIHGFVDKVIAGVMDFLSMQIPPYVRIDLLQIIITRSLSADKKFVNWTLRVASVHALKAPLPFIKSIEVSFSDEHKYKAAVLHEQPFNLKRRTVTTEAFEILLKLNFSDGCGCLCTQINIPFGFKGLNDCSKHDKDSAIQDLREKAIQDSCCGQNVVIERKTISVPKTEFTVHAVVTNIKSFESDSLNNDVKIAKGSMNGSETSRKRSKGRKRKSRF